MYVYLLESDGFYKIGIADNVNKRVRQLQTGNPHQIRVIQCFQMESKLKAMTAEVQIHALLKAANVSGEWFSFSDCEVSLLEEIFTAMARRDMKHLYALTCSKT